MLGLIIYTLGTGFGPAMRSLVTSCVEGDDQAELYAILGVMEALGSLLSGPSFSFAFHVGLEHGGMWHGLPFLVSTVLFLVVAIIVFRAKFD
jgi:hypothetical protein